MSAYKWTDKQLPEPSRASGFDAGLGRSDAAKQLERLKAENADLVKIVMGLKEEMYKLTEAAEAAKAESSKKSKQQADK